MGGLESSVTNELSPSGVVRLETLDGEPMATFISGGSTLKRYHEPLLVKCYARWMQQRCEKKRKMF